MAGPRLTVLQMLPALDGGGVEQGTLEVTRALTGAGHRALVMSAGGRLVQDIEAAGGEHLAWPVGRKSLLTLGLVSPLRALLHQEKVDVLHPRSRVPAWIAWLAWRRMPRHRRPRLVTTVHGFYRPGRYSAVMVRGERVICVSRAIEGYVRAHYPQVPLARLAVIPRGIDHARYPHGYHPPEPWLHRWTAEHPELAARRVLLLPARLTRLKGHEQFLDLLAALRREGLDVHGLAAGGEDPRRRAYAAGLRERVHALGLEDRVSFLGHRSDLREIMAVSDLVLSLSSKPESFGRVVLEALSLGRPTLGFAHGGVAEILGTLYPPGAVPPGDATTLAQTASRLLAAPPNVPATRAFALDDMLRATLDLYRTLCDAREPPQSA
jgi:glycosyltransferase involved in cell wall biosynthesis